MELIPALMIWVCMPVDLSPNLPPVRVEDLGMFPNRSVSSKECYSAERVRCYAARAYNDYCGRRGEGVQLERFWFEVRARANYSQSAWSNLKLAHDSNSEGSEVGVLYRLQTLRESIGAWNYYHGQMPAPVYAPGIPPVKAGDR